MINHLQDESERELTLYTIYHGFDRGYCAGNTTAIHVVRMIRMVLALHLETTSQLCSRRFVPQVPGRWRRRWEVKSLFRIQIIFEKIHVDMNLANRRLMNVISTGAPWRDPILPATHATLLVHRLGLTSSYSTAAPYPEASSTGLSRFSSLLAACRSIR